MKRAAGLHRSHARALLQTHRSLHCFLAVPLIETRCSNHSQQSSSLAALKKGSTLIFSTCSHCPSCCTMLLEKQHPFPNRSGASLPFLTQSLGQKGLIPASCCWDLYVTGSLLWLKRQHGSVPPSPQCHTPGYSLPTRR